MTISLIKTYDKNYTRHIIQTSMKSYYEKNNIIWNDEGFTRQWQRLEYFELWSDTLRVGILGYNIDNNICYLRDIHIESCYQGRGLGSNFLRKLIDIMKKSQRQAICLQVFEDNPAITLYERLGFKLKDGTSNPLKMELLLH